MNHFLNSDVIWLDSVDSTNDEIKRRIDEFSKPTWVIANKQSKGKGRNGNVWFSNQGNFFGSVIFFPTVEHKFFHLYGFFIGVALYNTVKQFVANNVDIQLKWPNDLMIENCKVAGILLEGVRGYNNTRDGLIAGIGVNLNSNPRLRANRKKWYNTQCLKNFTDKKINQSIFFKKFNNQLVDLGSNIVEENICSILTLWQARSYDKGSKIHISDSKGEINTGTFLGIDEIGGLIFGENTGIKKIYSGDVYFGS